MLVRVLPARGASLRRPRPASPAITLASPVSPQAPGVPLLVSGTYAGQPGRISVVWQQGGLDVGTPVDAAVIGGGAWSATLVTPAVAGTYTLRAAFDGTTPTADSAPILIQAAQPSALGSFGFEGTGAPADTIALFGHAFEQGTLQPTDPVVLRSGGSTLHRTQLNVLSMWGDGSVKTALMAAELPALADTQILTAELRSGQSHPDPGSALSFAAALAGRSATIKTWAPGNTTTPLWTYDPLAAIGTDRWHQGPLALSSRVATAVPSSAVQNTSGTTGVIGSVRLIVDVIVTKDGFLELDVCFSNDRVMHAAGGIARFGYTIEIDGVMVYDQRPSSGEARHLNQYCRWVRRRGRKADGTTLTGVGTSNRPFVRPDFELLVASGVQLDWDRTQPISSTVISGAIDTHVTAGESNLTDPWWNWGFNRFAGEVGGRPEIGYRTFANGIWLRDGYRNASILSQRQFEVYSAFPMYYYDWDLGRWLNPVDWPKMSFAADSSSAAGTARADAQGLPTGQRPTNNFTDHVTVDHAHHPSAAWTVALIGGRRLAYDSLAARAMWAGMDSQVRHNGSATSLTTNWRTLTPDHTTGQAWARRVWWAQTRDWSWDMRDVIDAEVILPDSYEGEHRIVYAQNVAAWFNAIKDVLPEIKGLFGDEIGFPIIHANNTVVSGYMQSFAYYSLSTAYRLGIGGEHMPEVVHELIKFRVNSLMDGGYPHRNIQGGGNVYVRTGVTGTYAQDWAQVWALSSTGPGSEVAVSEDWTTGSRGQPDYQRNVLSALAVTWGLDLPPALHARVADALVMVRSERQNAESHPWPRTMPNEFFGAFFMTNAAVPAGLNMAWDSAPVITPGQSFELAGDAASGAVIGVVRFTGCIPRNSAPGYEPGALAWEITDQPEGDPFEITMGGALKLAGNPPAAGSTNITVRARTYNSGTIAAGDPSGTLIQSDPVTVSVTTTAASAEITAITPASPTEVLVGAEAGTVVFTVTVTGNAPITPSITSGDDDLFEFVHLSGNTYAVRVADTLTVDTYPLTIRVENATGHDTAEVSIGVVSNVDAPVVTASQVFEIEETLSTGMALDPATAAYTGGAPTVAEFTAGNTGGRLAVAIDGGDVELTNAVAIYKQDLAQLTPTLRLANAAGNDSKAITVNIIQPWALKSTAPSALYFGVWSFARRVVSSYTGPLCRIRRANDNAEQDINATLSSGHYVLDESAVTTFVGANNWFVTTVYDQSLNGFDLAQATAGSQPAGGTSGGFNRVGTNSRVGANFNNTKLLTNAAANRPMMTAPVFIAAAARTGGVDSGGQILFQCATAGSTEVALRVSHNAIRIVTGNAALNHTDTLTDNAEVPVMLLGSWWAAGNDRVRIGWNNRGMESVTAGNSSLSPNNQPFNMGSSISNAAWKGPIAEVVLGRGLAKGSEEREVLAELMGFYGV